MKRKIACMLLACALFLPLLGGNAFAASPSGSCGPNLSWSLDQSTGVLTISGRGPMDDYASDAAGSVFYTTAPWWDYRRQITSVVVKDGVTSVGDHAFEGNYIWEDAYYSLDGVTLADSVESIGLRAFCNCEIQSLRLGAGLKSIGDMAFFYSYTLRTVVLPEGLESVGESAFVWTGMTGITIPRSVTSIGEMAFGYNTAISGGPAVLTGFTVRGCPGTAAEAYYKWLLGKYNELKDIYGSDPWYAELFPVGGTVVFIPLGAVGVSVNGAAVVWTDAEPFIDENSRTMVPLRPVAEALGLTVSWDGANREAVFTDGVRTLYFPIGSSAARTGGGGTVQMDTAAVIVSDRTYAPIRYLAEYFGYAVGWDGAYKTVLLWPGQFTGPDSTTVVWTRMNHSYWLDMGDGGGQDGVSMNHYEGGDGRGSIFVNHYYDLAAITDEISRKDQINDCLRSGYEAFTADSAPYEGGYDEGDTNYVDARIGELAQNSDGLLSLKYYADWWMGGVGDGSVTGVTVSLRSGRLLHLSDFYAKDGQPITLARMVELAAEHYAHLGAYPSDEQLDAFRQKGLDGLDFYIENNEIILCVAKYALADGATGPAEIRTGIFVRERF